MIAVTFKYFVSVSNQLIQQIKNTAKIKFVGNLNEIF